ncbi:MAG: hypothetical protein WDA68_11360 [Phycisphaerae bacterium]
MLDTYSRLSFCTRLVALSDSEESVMDRTLLNSTNQHILRHKDSSFSPFAKASAGQATQNDSVVS